MHVLDRHAGRPTDVSDRSFFLDPQNTTQVVVAILTCVARLCLRFEAVPAPKLP